MSLWRGSIDDDSLTAAWQELAEQAAQQAAQNKPWLLKLLANQGAALAARYALWKDRLRRLRQGERRRLQRQLGVGLAGAALLLALSGAPTARAGGPIVADGATCTLAEAIVSANTDAAYGGCTTGYAGADTIDLQADVTLTAANNSTYGPTGLPVITTPITIAGNGHSISRSSISDFRILAVGSGGDLTLNSATVSSGVAMGSLPDGGGGGIFVTAGLLTLTNSTLSGNSAVVGGGIFARDATVAVSNSTLSGNSAGFGGGIYAESATVTVSNSTLSGNSASLGGGGIFAIYATVAVSNSPLSGNSAGDGGGGILARYATVTVANSTLSGNSAGWGGGIFAYFGTATIANSTLSGNSVTYLGGGVYARSATVAVSNSTLSGNSASDGGGIYAGYATVTVSNSTLSGNSASAGGGIYARYSTVMAQNSIFSGNSAKWGGGIYVQNSTATVANSTLSGNSVTYLGGGIYARSATVTVSNSTLSGNSASDGGGIYAYTATVTVSRSLVSGNTAASSGNEIYATSVALASSYNLFGHDGETNAQAFTNFIPSGTDITATSDGTTPTALAAILTTPLADNDSTILAGAPPGAVVQTLALPAGSPAIDAAPSADCVAPIFDFDQRGKTRNVDGNASASANECDIGAFELQTEVVPRIIVHKQTLPNYDPTEFQFKLRGPVGRDFSLADDEPHSTGQIPAGIYTLEEIMPSGWDPAIPLDQMTCDDGSPLSAIDLGSDETLVCRFLNYKRGNIIVKKATIPPVAAPSFAMRLIDNTSLAKTQFSLANGGQFDTGAITSVPTYKLLEPAATLPGGWKKKSIACDNGSPATTIVVPPGGTVTCTVTNENSAPTNILLSNVWVAENKPVGTVVGTLTASDAIAGDTHTFAFVDDGTSGASGNGSFKIVGNQLQTNAVFDYETKTSYNIKLKATDTAGQSKVKNFVIKVLDKPG
ncbi:MAG: cadherin domain-containing protein [Caldilineales bacterium]|nr:cadherin domain-containing protein [Caldilineales bacterium]